MVGSKPLVEWVSESLPLGHDSYSQIDSDNLTGQPPVRLVQWSFDLFGELVSELARRNAPELALLVVPLAFSKRLLKSGPSIERMVGSSWSDIQVPGFYLLGPKFFDRWDPVEEYRSPIDLACLPGMPLDYAYYRCHRTIEDRRRGWEYARGYYFVGSASNGRPS